MSVKLGLAVAAALAATAGAHSALAGVVLSDNFDADTAVLNWAGDSTFVSVPAPGNVYGKPSVDLVGVADGFGYLAYSGNSVDLDGSTGTGFSPAGEIQSVQSLAKGDYTVSFLLAGNLRGAPVQTTVVSIGSQSYSITPSNTQPYTPYTLLFNDASGKVDFTDLGPATQQGDLLDNVSVSSVPEPMSWALMLVGVAGVGGVLRPRRRSVAAAA